MLKRLVVISFMAASTLGAGQAFAEQALASEQGSASTSSTASTVAPSAEDVQSAGLAFDAGRQAFRDERYEEAAEYFERADLLAPNAKVLRNAVSARLNAGQTDRAATLAILALRLYPSDEKLAKEMNELLERSAQNLHRLEVSCDPACQLLIGTRLVHGPVATNHTLFLSAGEHDIRASFAGGRTLSQIHSGELGATGQISFKASEPEKAAPIVAPVAPKEEQPQPSEPASVNDKGKSEPASGGLSPVVFWVGVGATAVVGGVSAWSAIDTKNSPGVDKVREECAFLQPSECKSLQTGKDKEMRTNILWIGTGGLAVATAIVGLFATDWGSSERTASDEERASSHRVAVVPWIDGTRTGLSATGRF